MRDPYWRDSTAALYYGDALEVLRELPDQTVDCIVTSPPDWTPEQPHRHRERLSHAPTPSLYVAALRRVMAEAHRALVDGGTCWLITKDRYQSDIGRTAPPSGRHARQIRDFAMTGLPATSLLGLPWQIAAALHDDGWIIRNAIIWHHPTAETKASADQRFLHSYEQIFLLVKQQTHYFAPETIQPSIASSPTRQDPGGRHLADHRLHHRQDTGAARHHGTTHHCRPAARSSLPPHAGQRRGGNHDDVWHLPARPFWNALPIEVPLLCIAAGCRPRGTVLDPYAGIATTGIAARELGRRFIGVEAVPTLCRLAAHRLGDATGWGSDPR